MYVWTSQITLKVRVRITAKDPLDILIDPDAKDADPKTWNEVFETKWMTLDEIEELYGTKCAERLLFVAENGMSFGPDSVEYQETRFGETENNDDAFRQRASQAMKSTAT